MDIVYVLGTGSRWHNNELRYSLRSVEKHLKAYDNVYIVGFKPGWLQNVIHIPADDAFRQEKERNIFHKITVACLDKRVSEDFIFFNDDHFLLQDVESMPYYHREPLEQYVKGRVTTYKISANNTLQALKRRGYSTLNFDVHAPIIYNKSKFLELKKYNWNIRGAYIIKSLYCNTHGITGEMLTDCKIQTPLTELQLHDRIKGRPVFSIGDGAITKTLRLFMDRLYPRESEFEMQIHNNG